MSVELFLEQDDVTVLQAAFTALREDELEPHDTLDYIGWRSAQHLGDPYYLLHGDSICEKLHRLLLLSATENDMPIQYRITRNGEQVIETFVATTASVSPPVSKEKVDEAAREILRLSHALALEQEARKKAERTLQVAVSKLQQFAGRGYEPKWEKTDAYKQWGGVIDTVVSEVQRNAREALDAMGYPYQPLASANEEGE